MYRTLEQQTTSSLKIQCYSRVLTCGVNSQLASTRNIATYKHKQQRKINKIHMKQTNKQNND